jgi:hypothetical protein
MKARAVGSAESDRRFSLTNNICPDERVSLSFKHINDLMPIYMIGQPGENIYQEIREFIWMILSEIRTWQIVFPPNTMRDRL